MSVNRCIPLIKLFLVPSLAIIIVGFSSSLTNKASSQGPPKLSTRTNSQNPPIKLSNRTGGLEAVKIEIKNGRVRLTLKNNFNKTITAYSISTGNHTHSLHELSLDDFLTPGLTRNQEVSHPSEGNITILAAVFDDKTSDGDPAAAKEISDYRFGKKTQYERIIPLLNKVVSASDNELQLALEGARSKILRLSADSVEKSHFILSGLSDAKESVLMDLKEFKQQLEQPEDIKLVRDRIARRNQAFQRYCQFF